MARMYYEKDCDLGKLDGKKIGIGYGSQGHAHALNLKESGCDVCVGLRQGSKNWSNAEAAGLKVQTVADTAKWADIIMILVNDEVQADVYKKDIAPNLEAGNMLMFAHGFNIHFKQIVPPAGPPMWRARACPAWWPWSKTPRGRPWTWPWPMPRASAAREAA